MKKNIFNFKSILKSCLGSTIIQDISVANEDLSGYIFNQVQLQETEFIQCDFSNARIGLKSKVIFKNTLFKKVDFRSAGIVNVVFENCQFINCDFRGTALDNLNTYFFSCVFKNCKISDQKFLVKNFQYNIFIGKISEIKFTGDINSINPKNYQLNLNLSECRFSFFEFIDCDLSNIIPPKHPNYLFIDNLKTRIHTALENIESNKLSPVETKKLTRRLNFLKNFDCYIFNIHDELYIYGNNLTKYFFILINFPIDDFL